MRFRLPRGISETNSQFFQIFLGKGQLFFKNVARILAGVKGFGLPPHPGGGLVFRPCFARLLGLACVPACGLSDSQRQGKTSAPPLPSLVPCNQFSPQNGLLYYTGRKNGSTGLKWASVGLLLNRLRACPVKKGRKGEKSVSLACLPPLLARPVLCSASVALCRSVCRAL